MKKIISVLLCVLIVFSSSSVAFASDEPENTELQSTNYEKCQIVDISSYGEEHDQLIIVFNYLINVKNSVKNDVYFAEHTNGNSLQIDSSISVSNIDAVDGLTVNNKEYSNTFVLTMSEDIPSNGAILISEDSFSDIEFYDSKGYIESNFELENDSYLMSLYSVEFGLSEVEPNINNAQPESSYSGTITRNAPNGILENEPEEEDLFEIQDECLDTSASFTWNAIEDAEYYSVTINTLHNPVYNTNTNSITITNLIADSEFRITITAYDEDDEIIAVSEEFTFRTCLPIPYNVTHGSLTTTSVELSWDCATAGNIVGYEIYRDGVFVDTSASKAFTDDTITQTGNYTYTIRSYYNNDKKSAESEQLSVSIVNDTDAPSTPQNLSSSFDESDNVVLSWSSSTDNTEVWGYNIYRDNVYLDSTTDISYTDSNIVANSRYTYEIAAYDYYGNESQRSSSINVGTRISAPSDVHITSVSNGVLNFSWSSISTATSYEVYVDGQTQAVNSNSFSYSYTKDTSHVIKVKSVSNLSNTLSSNWSEEFRFIPIGGDYTGTQSWNSTDPYIVVENVEIKNSATVTISNGAKLYFTQESGNSLVVKGTLNISGTSSNRVLLSSAYCADLNGQAGRNWGNIVVEDSGILTSKGNIDFSYTDIRYGQIISSGNIEISNSTINNCTGFALDLFSDDDSETNIQNNTFSGLIMVKVDYYDNQEFAFSQNTINNSDGYPFYFDLSGEQTNQALIEYLCLNNNSSQSLYNSYSVGGEINDDNGVLINNVRTLNLPNLNSSNSTYNARVGLQETLIIPEDFCLNLTDGTQLWVDAWKYITVNGIFNSIASGSEYVITINSSGTWNGISISDTGSADLQYTNLLNYHTINCNGNLNLYHCYIESKGTSVNLSMSATHISDSYSIDIYYCTFKTREVCINMDLEAVSSENISVSVCNNTFKRWIKQDTLYIDPSDYPDKAEYIKIDKLINVDESCIINNTFEILKNTVTYTQSVFWNIPLYNIYDYAGVKPIRVNLYNVDLDALNNITGNVLTGDDSGNLSTIFLYTSGSLSNNTAKTLPNCIDKYVLEFSTIDSNLTLTMNSGTKMIVNGTLTVNGTLNLLGTVESRNEISSYYSFPWVNKGYNNNGNKINGITISSTGTLNLQYTDIYADNGSADVITDNGKLIMVGSSLGYVTNTSTGKLIHFNTTDQTVLNYNCFYLNNSSDYDTRRNSNPLKYALYNNKANEITINAGENYWGTDAGPSTDGSTHGLVLSSGFDLKSVVFDSTSNSTNGVSSGTRNFSTSSTDMSCAVPGFTLDITRTYSSGSSAECGFGKGWSFNYYSKFTRYYCTDNGVEKEIIIVSLPDGTGLKIEKANNSYTAITNHHKVAALNGGGIAITTKDHTTYCYNGNGYLYSISDKNGNEIAITVDENGVVSRVEDCAGRAITISRTNNLITSITDFSGRTVNYSYTNGKLVSVTDPNGNVYRTYEYNSNGNMTAVKDADGNTISAAVYAQNSNGISNDITCYIDQNGKQSYYLFNNVNHTSTVTDQNGNSTVDYLDDNNNIIQTIDAEGGSTTKTYVGTAGDISSITDSYGNQTQYTFDSNGNITSVTNPDNSTQVMTYDNNNNIITFEQEDKGVTYYTYDENGNMLVKAQALTSTPYSSSADESLFSITKYTYYTDEETTQNNWHTKGLLKTETDPNGNVTTYNYDAYGNVVSKTVGSYAPITYTYDSLGRCISETSSAGVVTEYIYDDNSNLLLKDVGGSITRYVYDSENRKIQEISPNQYDSTEDGLNQNNIDFEYDDDTVGAHWSYNTAGNVTSETDAAGNTTEYTYDIYGNVVSEKLPSGAIYLYTYDAIGRKTQLSYKESEGSAEKLLEEYSYSSFESEENTKTITSYYDDSNYSTSSVTYNYDDKEIQSVDGNGTVTQTTYTGFGEIQSVEREDYYELHKFDSLGRETQTYIKSDADHYIYNEKSYDKCGNILSESIGKTYVSSTNAVPNSLSTYSYTYDVYGKVLTKTGDNGIVESYTYNGDGNVLTQTVYYDANKSQTVTYTYNSAGNIITKSTTVTANELTVNTNNGVIVETYTYDLNGNILTFTDTAGTVYSYTYDDLDRRISESYSYQDSQNQTVSATSTYEYNWNDQLLRSTDYEGNITLYNYSADGLLTAEVAPNGGVTKYSYDLAGRKLSEITANNFDCSNPDSAVARTEYEYDDNANLTKETVYLHNGQNGAINSYVNKKYEYDEYNHISKVYDALGYENDYYTECEYDFGGNLTFVLDPVAADNEESYSAEYEYNPLGLVAKETDANGVETVYGYDSYGNLTSTAVDNQTISSATYDRQGNQLTSTDGNGNITTYQYTDFGKVKQINYPYDSSIGEYIEYYKYDTLGNVTEQSDNCQKVVINSYDGMSNLISSTEKKSDNTQSITLSYEYDLNGSLVSETDGNGNVKDYTYSPIGAMTTETLVDNSGNSPVTKTTSYCYDAEGNAVSSTDCNDNTTCYEYDELGRPISKTKPSGIVEAELEYDNNSNLITALNALGNGYEYTYDKLNRQTSVTDSCDNTETTDYDGVGNIIAKTDANENTTEYSYDEFNNLVCVDAPENESASYEYDLNGNIISKTDSLGNTKYYEYNAANQLYKRIDVGGITVEGGQTVYDDEKIEYSFYYPNGQLKVVNDRQSNSYSGQVLGGANSYGTHYEYDIHGNLTEKYSVSNDNNDPIQVIGEFEYDDNGNAISITDCRGTTLKSYDALGRATSKTEPGFGTSVYTYDVPVSNVTGASYKKTEVNTNNDSVETIYDSDGNIIKVVANGEETDYTYNDDGSVYDIRYDNGLIVKNSYYSNGLLSKQEYYFESYNDKRSEYNYQYDAVGNLVAQKEQEYEYDGLNRLTYFEDTGTANSRSEEYTYSNGNISSVAYTYNSSSDTEIKEFTYDENGRNTEILYKYDTSELTEPIVVGRVDNTYDNNGNQLSALATYREDLESEDYVFYQELDNSYTVDNTSISTTYEYYSDENLVTATETVEYNAYGQLAKKIVGGVTILYSYDEEGRLRYEKESNQSNPIEYVYGVDLICSGRVTTVFYTYLNNPSYYVKDASGNVRDVYSASTYGRLSISRSYRYSPFGQIYSTTIGTNSPNASNIDSLRYAGALYDNATKLYHMGGRTYNQDTLQFLQEDSYLGDITDVLSLNQYAYCKDNPLRYIDPTGHSAEESQSGLSLIDIILNNIFSFLNALSDLGDNPVDPVNSKVQNEIQSQSKHLTAKMPSNFLDKLQEALNPSDSVVKGSGLIIGLTAMAISVAVVTNPIAASMLLCAGMSVSLQVITDCLEGNKTSISSLVTSAAVGAVSGAAAGAAAVATEAAITKIGYDVASHFAVATVSGVSGAAYDVTTQIVTTGKVDAKEVILSTALAFGTGYALSKGSEVVANKLNSKAALAEKIYTSDQTVKTDFYAAPNGEIIPSTGYRYIDSNSPYLDDIINSKNIPANPRGTYFSFDNYIHPNPGALQVPHDASYKLSFDTLQIIDDIRIPYGKWGKASYLEPFARDFPEYGRGGATQVITKSKIAVSKIEQLF